MVDPFRSRTGPRWLRNDTHDGASLENAVDRRGHRQPHAERRLVSPNDGVTLDLGADLYLSDGFGAAEVSVRRPLCGKAAPFVIKVVRFSASER